jgi:hypothetical protein
LLAVYFVSLKRFITTEYAIAAEQKTVTIYSYMVIAENLCLVNEMSPISMKKHLSKGYSNETNFRFIRRECIDKFQPLDRDISGILKAYAYTYA